MKYLEKHQIIQNEIGQIPELKEFQFETWTDERNGSSWIFKKETQYFEIFDKFTYVDARIVQESPIRRVIYLQNMIPIDFEDIFKSIGSHGYNHKTENEFKKNILSIRALLLKYGFKKLSEIKDFSIDVDKLKEEGFFLYIEKNHNMPMDYLDMQQPSSPESELSRISMLVRGLRGCLYSDIIKFLLDISIVYGNWIIRNFGGEWCWEKEVYGIKNVGKTEKFIVPIDDILKAWGMKGSISLYKLKEEYRES